MKQLKSWCPYRVHPVMKMGEKGQQNSKGEIKEKLNGFGGQEFIKIKKQENKGGGQIMISLDGAVMVIVDMQKRLIPHIWEKEGIIMNIQMLIKGM